jgi:hypothetical protein
MAKFHPRSQGLTADTALPEALAKTKTELQKSCSLPEVNVIKMLTLHHFCKE